MNKKNSTNKVLKLLHSSLFVHINSESDRGFVLIATACVDDFLTQVFESILPEDLDSRSKKNKIFKYPGCLDSLSSKVELAYICRLIDTKTYEAINVLRKIRNHLAHGTEGFSIEDNNNLSNLYAVLVVTDENIKFYINHISGKVSFYAKNADKQDTIQKIMQDSDLDFREVFDYVREEYKKQNLTDEQIEKVAMKTIESIFDEEMEKELEDFYSKISKGDFFWKFKLFICTFKICLMLEECSWKIQQIYAYNQNHLSIYEKMAGSELLDPQ